jgi:hypothetical protein
MTMSGQIVLNESVCMRTRLGERNLRKAAMLTMCVGASVPFCGVNMVMQFRCVCAHTHAGILAQHKRDDGDWVQRQ